MNRVPDASDEKHKAFWSLWNARLDERRDPLDDAEVVAYLSRNPELLDEVGRARQALESLERTTPVDGGVPAADEAEMIDQVPAATPAGARIGGRVAAVLLTAAASLLLVLRIPVVPSDTVVPRDTIVPRDTEVPRNTVVPLNAEERRSPGEVLSYRVTVDVQRPGRNVHSSDDGVARERVAELRHVTDDGIAMLFRSESRRPSLDGARRSATEP